MQKEIQIKENQQRIKELEKKNNEIKIEVEKLQREQEKKEKPYQEKISEIQSEYNKKIIPLEKIKDKNEDTISTLQRNIRNLELEIEIEKSKKEQKHNTTTVRALFKRYDLGDIDHEENAIIEKKTLKNGVQIFRITDGWKYDMWLAFYKLKLIGLSYRKKGEHRGDTTIPFSFIGGLNNRNLIKLKREIRYSQKYIINESKKEYETLNATFTDWSKKLEKKKVDTLKEIALNEKNVECIKKRECIEGRSWY